MTYKTDRNEYDILTHCLGWPRAGAARVRMVVGLLDYDIQTEGINYQSCHIRLTEMNIYSRRQEATGRDRDGQRNNRCYGSSSKNEYNRKLDFDHVK